MTRRWPIAGLLFGVLWVFVRGVELSVDAVLAQFLTGVLIGLPVAYVFRRLYEEGIEIRETAASIPYAVLYLLVFVREVVVANVDVTYRVLAPSMPIEPEVIYIPLRVRTDVGVTTIANSITITPGTITLDHDPDENALYVHVIDGRDPAEIVEPIRTWEDYALLIFDEELSPSDPAPPVRVTPEDTVPEPRSKSPAIEALDTGRGSTEPTDERDRGERTEGDDRDMNEQTDSDETGGSGTDGETTERDEGGETDGGR